MTIKAKLRKSYDSKPIPSLYQEVIDNLGDRFGDWVFRWSHRGTPHLLLEHDGVVYSLCHFKKRNIWRLFFPYMATYQNRAGFSSWEEAIDYILN